MSSSFKAFVTSSKFNIVCVFIPIALFFSFSGAPATVVFTLNFIAIMPLAKLLGFATEELALMSGPTVGALLNATFGNVVELILGVIALKDGLIRVVQASVMGSILSNILLVLGFCFLLGGVGRVEQQFSMTAAQTSSSLLALTTLSLLVPAAFSATADTAEEAEIGILNLSHGTALVLLVVYGLSLLFQVRFDLLFKEDDDEEEPTTTMTFSFLSLFAVAGLVSIHADFLVGAIEGVVESWEVNETFVGVILLPIIGNAAEHVSSVTFAMKNKMNLSINIAISSSLQIGLFVTPVLVIAGWIFGQPMSLFFEDFETVVLFSSVLIVNYLIQDGHSNWLEGTLLLASYTIIAMAFWFHPTTAFSG
ncbi:Sodium/calcium exchanger protein-domain-containing protein [Zychaea mexicana]|uniref:Sodium/calcium exchanger protein-domain-containing protein n=1 Tax=Zychaea mexicana TaxID=64656 RepID=UPI0022FEBE04|nr:Sodium/calcium exchanger protein-domain-containing protein [Zychaea mexicana]KAI9491675.1 Sodium/calcium exchanger protein-domain-containing protein [Zychaea mexicana]